MNLCKFTVKFSSDFCNFSATRRKSFFLHRIHRLIYVIPPHSPIILQFFLHLPLILNNFALIGGDTSKRELSIAYYLYSLYVSRLITRHFSFMHMANCQSYPYRIPSVNQYWAIVNASLPYNIFCSLSRLKCAFFKRTLTAQKRIFQLSWWRRKRTNVN